MRETWCDMAYHQLRPIEMWANNEIDTSELLLANLLRSMEIICDLSCRDTKKNKAFCEAFDYLYRKGIIK